MSQIDKLIHRIRNNPRDVRFDDACKVAEKLGFQRKGGNGSHHVFSRSGEVVALNFQPTKDAKLKPYQAKQLIEMIEKYGAEQAVEESDPHEQDEEITRE